MTRIAAAARTLASLLVITAILAAAAAALVTWAGWPLPERLPTAAELANFADQPLDYLSAKLVLAVAGWLLWLILALSVGLEAWIRLARRPPPVILPRPLRVLAAGMLGTSVVALTTPAHASPPAASPTTTEHPPTRPTADSGKALTQNAARPVPAPTTTETSTPAGGQDRPDADATPSVHTPRGIDIPGGWIAWPVAAGVLAATAITLLHSRTIPPASALLRAIRTARHHPTDPGSEETTTTTTTTTTTVAGDDITDLEHDATTTLPFTIGLHGATQLGIDSLPSSGAGITGPGSADALRGILAAAATCSYATVVIPADLLHALTGAQPPLPGTTATKDANAAMHTLQMEIHRRYTTTSTSTSEPAPVEDRQPPLLLLIAPPAHPRRLAALAELGSQHNIRVVIAGPWQAGHTWSVDHHGHTTCGTATVGRLNILNPEALAQIAHTLQPREHDASPAKAPPGAPPPSAPFHLSILGPLRLATTSDPGIHIRRSGSRQIAVYLALHPDGASRDELLEQIFGHMTLSSATTSLNSCLYELRRLLTTSNQSALIRLDDTYRLDPQFVTVDWWLLLHHLQRGHLTQATAHYTGPIADGHTWHWLPEHRQSARHLIADAHATLARTATTPDDALTHALAGITVDPYSTACCDAAVDAYMRRGHPDHAHAIREEMAQRLARLDRATFQRQPQIRTDIRT